MTVKTTKIVANTPKALRIDTSFNDLKTRKGIVTSKAQIKIQDLCDKPNITDKFIPANMR